MVNQTFKKILIETLELKDFISQKLLSNLYFVQNLNLLKEYIEDTKVQRRLSGVAKICADCGNAKTDCCGKGVEFKYSKELLLINLLLGVQIPLERPFSQSCHFLSSKGCILLARHVFCINFLCQRLRAQVTHEQLLKLQESEGKELELLFKIEELIKKELRSAG